MLPCIDVITPCLHACTCIVCEYTRRKWTMHTHYTCTWEDWIRFKYFFIAWLLTAVIRTSLPKSFSVIRPSTGSNLLNWQGSDNQMEVKEIALFCTHQLHYFLCTEITTSTHKVLLNAKTSLLYTCVHVYSTSTGIHVQCRRHVVHVHAFILVHVKSPCWLAELSPLHCTTCTSSCRLFKNTNRKDLQ